MRSTPTPSRCRAPMARRCGPPGGAVSLVDALLGGAADVGVSALRPPGHHAEAARAMGFCFFGNIAVAARRATSAHGLSRVLIVDWDVHHGNGTNDIFHADADVLFVSIHESPLYPGTGPASDVGSGRGGGLHREPARAGWVGGRGLSLFGGARGVRAGAGLAARVGADQRRVRRAPRRSARDLSRDRGRVRGDGGFAAASRRRRWARRWASCWRAATTSARWPARWPRSCRSWSTTSHLPWTSRRVHPLAARARERLERYYDLI